MSDVVPSSELQTVVDTFDRSLDDAERLVVNGVMAGFAPIEVRRRIVDQQIRPPFRAGRSD